MRKLFSLTMMGAVAMSMAGFTGCSDEASTKSQTTTTGPGGTATVTSEKKVETTGSNPPAPVKAP